MSIKISFKKIINYIFSFLLVLSCNSVIYYNNDIVKYIFLVGLSIFFCTNVLPKRKLNSKSFLILVIYYLLVILYGLFFNFGFKYIFTYIIVLPSLYLVFTNNDMKHSILENVLNIVVFLAILSLIMFFLGPVTGIIKPSGTILNAWTSNENMKNYIESYYNLHYYTQHIIINGNRFIRNSGIFTETPMFSLVLSTALAIELFISEKKSRFKAIILLVTVFTTLSTTGIVVSMFMLFLNYLIKNDKNYLKALKIILFPIFVIVLGYIALYFLRDKLSSSSYSLRMDDYIACIKAWLDHPIFGNGMFDTSAIVSYMNSNRNINYGLSNSFFVLLAEGGIYFTMIYCIPVINAINYSFKYNKKIFLFIIIMLILFVTTIFQFTPFCLCLIALAMSVSRKEALNKHEN